jgi:hypothetical protein
MSTYSLLAMTPAVSVEPLLPPHPTSITLQHQKRDQLDKRLTRALHVANMHG